MLRLVLLPPFLVGAGGVIGFVMIAVRLHLNTRASEPILAALTERYPDTTFRTSSGSVEKAVVWVGVDGIKDKTERAALLEWLAELKVERGLTVNILVTFDGEFFSPEQQYAIVK